MRSRKSQEVSPTKPEVSVRVFLFPPPVLPLAFSSLPLIGQWILRSDFGCNLWSDGWRVLTPSWYSDTASWGTRVLLGFEEKFWYV